VAGRVSAKRATAAANDDATPARRPTARRVAAASAATAGSPTSVFGRGPAPSSGESVYRDASEPSGVSRASTAATGPSGAARRVAPHVAGAVHVDASGLSPSSVRPAASRAPTPRAAPRDTAADLAVARELACPRCQSRGLLTGARGWGCARWREGCGFVVWFEIGGRSLRADQLRQLVQHGEVRERFEREGAIHEARWVLDPVAVGGAARIEST
jgi:DNA topoisomerase-3